MLGVGARSAALAALLAFVVAHGAHAEDATKDKSEGEAAKSDEGGTEKNDSKLSFNEAFEKYGYTLSSASVTKAACRVQFDLNQQTFVSAIPDLQKAGLLNPDLSQTKINTSPNMISLAFMIQMLPFAVKHTYDEHPDVDRCQFTQYLTTVDDYGHDKRTPAAAFGFSRATYAKINWDNFESTKLSKVATGFHYTSDFMRAILAERRLDD